MSEEEEIIFDDEEPIPEEEEEFPVDPNEMTPEEKYQYAKGLDDLEAVDIFYSLYADLNADVKIQGKSLKRAAIILSTTDDYERILGSITDVFSAFQEGVIDNAYCTKIVKRMISNLIRNEQALSDFLDVALENVSKRKQLPLYVDLKLRQAEMSLKKADYITAQNHLSEINQNITIPPDKKDSQMCDLAFRTLLLQIDLTDAFTQDEDEIFVYFQILKDIPENSMNDRQKALLNKIEGQICLHRKEFDKAVSLFQKSFYLFDDSGSDKRLDVLPFYALAIMCTEDKDAIVFNDTKISPYVSHPIVAPLKQLLDEYKSDNYVKFCYLLDPAKKVFQMKVKNADFYFSLLDKVRAFVLRNNILRFCASYLKIELKFLAMELKSSVEEVRKLVFDLILEGEMQAVVDTDANLIIVLEVPEKSIYLENIKIMIDSLGDTIRKLTAKERIIL